MEMTKSINIKLGYRYFIGNNSKCQKNFLVQSFEYNKNVLQKCVKMKPWIHKLWCIHTIKSCAATKNDFFQVFNAIWRSLGREKAQYALTAR